MTLRAPKPLMTSIRPRRRGPESGAPPTSLILRATPRGCALMNMHGEVVFHADGIRGRRECLEYARRHGVLALSR